MKKILIIDDETPICRTLALHLKQQGYQPAWVNTAEEGLERMKQVAFHAVILDIHLPDMDGLTALRNIRESGNKAHVIIITAFHDLELPVKAMQYGAVEFIHKPIDIDELDKALNKFSRTQGRQEKDESVPLSDQDANAMVVGHSKAMKEIFKLIGMVSQTKSTVLIEGESGTGKELIARAIHNNTPEIKGPFISVNCAAIVETLLESELFGHERGAFTGAVTRKDGKFAYAKGGTLFLDEIGDMSPKLQAKLLRVLQERKFERVGGKESIVFDGRIVAATNHNLEEDVRQGSFREDLFYRLNVVSICMPPLRDRREDIPVLVSHLLNRINTSVGKKVSRIPASTMAKLVAYDWPGNVREMENILTRAVVMAKGDALQLDLGQTMGRGGYAGYPDVTGPVKFPSLAEAEKDLIARVLDANGWHKGRACEILGISRPRLERKINLYHLARS